MSASRAVRLALLALAALPAFASADDAADLLERARQGVAGVATPAAETPASARRSCTDGLASAAAVPAKFCGTVDDCQAFCSCACTFDPLKWKANEKNDGSTTCPGAPTTGSGMISPDSGDLARLSDAGLRFITFDPDERAATAALDGLRRLDARLAASRNRRRYGYTVRVVSCYRPQTEDTEAECGFVLKGRYMLARVSDPRQVRYWRTKSDPTNLGLKWPGATPHSGGFACDLVLVDRDGRDSFDSRAGVDGAPTSSIPQRDASRMLDEEVTNADVGGSRLDFEAWHYEWGTATASRCKAPDCANEHWPVTGRP